MNTMLLHLSHFVKCRSLLFSEYGFINVKATMFFFSKTLFLLISIQIMSDQEGDRRQTSFSRPPPNPSNQIFLPVTLLISHYLYNIAQ